MATPVCGKKIDDVTLGEFEKGIECFAIKLDDGSAMCIQASYDWNHNQTYITWSYYDDADMPCKDCLEDAC